MPKRDLVSAPGAHVLTDTTGVYAANVDKAPPQDGTDYALQVYANLGSEVVAVDQILYGAPNWATTQLTANGSAQLLLAARATRRSAIVTNTDPVNSIYIGNAGVTALNGQVVPPNSTATIPVTASVYVITTSPSVLVTTAEGWD